MRLKTFSAPTMATAMAQVRHELGDQAIIVSTEATAAGGVRITAALEDDADGRFPSESSLAANVVGQPGEAISAALAFHRVPGALRERLTADAGAFLGEGDVLALAAALDANFGFHPLVERVQNRPLMLVGTPGAGKTLAAAKLLMRARRQGRRLQAISTDTVRAGGVEQLAAFTRILGVELATADGAAAIGKAAKAPAKAGGALIVIDTAGTNPFNHADLQNLAELIAATAAEPILVQAAGGDADEAADIAASFATTGVRRLLVTRLDIVRRLGSLLAAAEAGGLALTDVSISPHVADGLTVINPVSLARLLLPECAEQTSHAHLKETLP